MKENKTKKENKIPNKNKKLKVISIILILLLIILGVVSFAYSQNIKLAKNNNEEQEVEESKTQEIVLEDNKYMHNRYTYRRTGTSSKWICWKQSYRRK